VCGTIYKCDNQFDLILHKDVMPGFPYGVRKPYFSIKIRILYFYIYKISKKIICAVVGFEPLLWLSMMQSYILV